MEIHVNDLKPYKIIICESTNIWSLYILFSFETNHMIHIWYIFVHHLWLSYLHMRKKCTHIIELNLPFTYLFIRPSPWHTTISSFPRQPNVSGDSDCRKGLGQANETLLVTSRSYEKVPEGRQPNMGQFSTGRELPPWKNDVISSVKVTVTIIKILSYRQ